MKKINIVLWGIGQHSINKILPAIDNCKSLNLYGLFSRNKKVLDKNVKKLISFIELKHSYECPSIIAFPIKKTNNKFLKWVKGQTN